MIPQLSAPRSRQLLSLPDADPRADRPRCEERKSNFLAAIIHGSMGTTVQVNNPFVGGQSQ